MKKIITDLYFYGNTGIKDHTDYIVSCMPEVELHPTYVGNPGGENYDIIDKKQRHSKNAHISVHDNPFMPMINKIMHNANNLIWKMENYEGVWETDTLNYIVYDEPGAHFIWHADSYDWNPERYRGRLLSMSYCLSHASDYEGCEFCIGDEEFKMDYGDFIVFPSQNVEHMIKPMISGERRVLVGFSN